MLVGVAGDPCGLQGMIREFQSVGEGERHKKAKYILANFLNSDTGKAEFYIQEVIVEKEIPGLSLEVIPDIRLEHSDGRPDSYVEIVDASAPHQNSNAWNFYKDKLTQLIPIDIKDNERGWHYDKAGIHKLLVDRFRDRFEDRINTPKIWDDVSAAVTNYEKFRKEQHIKDTGKSKEREEEGTSRRQELSKRENELLQLTKQHLAINCHSMGLTAFEYGLLDGPKGGNRTSDPISDYGMGDPNLNASVLSEYPKIIERDLYRRIESDLVEQGLAEWVCRKCMGHHKTYRDCPNAKCDYTNWLKNEERRINRGYYNKRFGKKKRDQYLEELREREEPNPSTTEYCSLCTVLLQEHSVRYNGVTMKGRLPSPNYSDSYQKRRESAAGMMDYFRDFMNVNMPNATLEFSGALNLDYTINYAEPLTESQVDELAHNLKKDFEMGSYSFIRNNPFTKNEYETLGFRNWDKQITPNQFYSKISPEIVCPKCDKKPGGKHEMRYTPGCDCDQGRVASDCETCEGGTIRPDIVLGGPPSRYLHLKLNCDCSTDPHCTGHRWQRSLLVSASDEDLQKLSIVCACCGFKVFGDDYIVGDRIREFWICRSANRMLTDSEYEELLYARHGCELGDWFSNDAWRDYIDG